MFESGSKDPLKTGLNLSMMITFCEKWDLSLVLKKYLKKEKDKHEIMVAIGAKDKVAWVNQEQ